jgi:hypothetical protein
MRLSPIKRAATTAPPDPAQPGLDAFAPEGANGAAQDPAAVQGTRPWITRTLALVVLLQAPPTILWITEQVRPVAAAVSPPMPAPPASAMAAAPCEPPAPAAPAPAESVVTPPVERPAPAGLLAGIVNVATPLPMDIYRAGRLVGTTEADSLMLPLGTHELEFVNDEVGYRVRRSVRVEAGRPASIAMELPRAPLHVNALPWAEVWIDGARIGETPIGNLQQPIGRHEVVFRHPELGERTVSVLVTLKEPARVSADLRKR